MDSGILGWTRFSWELARHLVKSCIPLYFLGIGYYTGGPGVWEGRGYGRGSLRRGSVNLSLHLRRGGSLPFLRYQMSRGELPGADCDLAERDATFALMKEVQSDG